MELFSLFNPADGEGIIGILFYIIFIIFIIFGQKIMILQTIWRSEFQLKKIKNYNNKAIDKIFQKLKKKTKKPVSKDTKQNIHNFMEFFISTPVDLDPYGIVKKIEHIMDRSENRFNYFVDKIAPNSNFNKEDKKDLKFASMGAMGVHQIYKILHHFIETLKKTGNIQIMLLLQMYMPLLIKMAKSNLLATKAFLNNIPIGDAIGPYIAANLMTKKGEVLDSDIVVSKETINKKSVFVMKADGPGSALGKIGRAIEKLHKKENIDYIITIDAAGKLEGEKTGSVAEGVGVMMGGIGVERSKIEEVSAKNDIPTDGIVIKMAPEEASIPMKKKIFKATNLAIEKLKNAISESDAKKILVIGVGNTCGIGNSKDEIKNLEAKMKPIWEEQKKKELEQKKKKKSLIYKIFGSPDEDDDL
ncbi:MAG: hypothetical protein B6U87_00665 [Candidatus Aenigmarchaeota archaeon ex4484_52]|nr:MAG: hypothetical protein B6U87_00665 [Candidatus Aenigmarchaeota archaeon ex4484_52]